MIGYLAVLYFFVFRDHRERERDKGSYICIAVYLPT